MNVLKSKLILDWLKGISPKPKVNKSQYPSKYLKSKKILFLEPRGAKANIFSNVMKYPLLGPLRMTTILRQHGYNAIMYHENLAKKDIPEKILKSVDILIFSLLTQTAKRGYFLADQYKKYRPDGKVIIGGIHPSMNPNEGLPYCDYLCIGEGEEIILDLIEGKFKEKIVKTKRIDDLTKLLIPDLSVVVNNKRIKIAPILTSLGCPFGCTFCCVTEMYGRKYRLFSIEQTIKAINQYLRKYVFFLDDNFCVDKKRALMLFSKIKELDHKFIWLAQVRADIATDESFIKEMALAGCRRVFIGFESVNQNSLNEIEKKTTLEVYKNAIKVFHNNGIPIHAMFILGLDNDDNSVFEKTVKFCKDNAIESVQFLIITPLPGTSFFKNLDKNRLINDDIDLYDGNHVIVEPKNMTASQLFEGILWAYDKFYSWSSILKQFLRDIQNFHKENLRTKRYRIRKMFNNIYRSIGFRSIIKKLKKISRIYRTELEYYPAFQNKKPIENHLTKLIH
ncbi:MAG: B12-binding domain-containing radical SAM protein [Promethearchaeota archaeon]